MSSEKSKNKMNSIAWKMNWLWFWKKFCLFLFVDFWGILAVCTGWIAQRELEAFGEIEWQASRSLTGSGDFRQLVYHVVYSKERRLDLPLESFVQVAVVVLSVIGTMEVLHLLVHLLGDSNDIKNILEPLKKMARKTKELSDLAMDEQKYRKLEDAISHMNPQSEEEYLNLGEKDLIGLENAINQLIRRMRASYEQQARFVSDASHELRTPISVIQGYVNLLDRWGKEDESVLDESIEALKQESEHMSRLVEQLLFLARGDSGRQKMTITEFALDRVVREVLEECEMIDHEHTFRMKKEIDSEINVVGDETLIKQALRIFTDNARKYTGRGEEICFDAGKDAQGMAYFSVQDNGSGMKESDLAHIFDRFYRSDKARSSATGGTGLGLSIAKWIVEQHGGTIEVLSREEIGTRITVCFRGMTLEKE